MIDNDRVINKSFGETKPGNNRLPRYDSLIRIASITKLITSEIMVKLAFDGKLKLTDPLKKYALPRIKISDAQAEQPITLLNLATHTSGLPREMPGGKTNRVVFTWPNKMQRWQWLSRTNLIVKPGTNASYSNLAYDLLADALSKASGKPYTQLLREKVTLPIGMKNTTFTPTAAQCARLMVGVKSNPCTSTIAAAGSGGIYSTPEDMQRWMQQFLHSARYKRKPTAASEQKLYFQRDSLFSLVGMDVAGIADALGLGWVYMAPKDGMPGIMLYKACQ